MIKVHKPLGLSPCHAHRAIQCVFVQTSAHRSVQQQEVQTSGQHLGYPRGEKARGGKEMPEMRAGRQDAKDKVQSTDKHRSTKIRKCKGILAVINIKY